MKSFIVLLSCCLLPALGAAAQGTTELHESIIIDGTFASVDTGRYYDTIQATNGGRLDMTLNNLRPIRVGRFFIDEESSVICRDWRGTGDYGDQSADGSGGSYGGRGGGEHAGDPIGNPNLPDIVFFQALSPEEVLATPQGGKSFRVRCVPSGDWLETYGGPSAGNAESTWIVADEFHLEGKITYNGEEGGNVATGNVCAGNHIGGGGGGGGAGGGILILARTLYIGPSAEITANGAVGGLGAKSMRELTGNDVYASFGEDGFPGAGGRIKIFYEQGTIEPGAVIVALAGVPNDREPFAEDGTVFIRRVPSIDQVPPPADLDCNGVVDSRDLFLFMQQWHHGVTPTPTPGVTPTP